MGLGEHGGTGRNKGRGLAPIVEPLAKRSQAKGPSRKKQRNYRRSEGRNRTPVHLGDLSKELGRSPPWRPRFKHQPISSSRRSRAASSLSADSYVPAAISERRRSTRPVRTPSGPTDLLGGAGPRPPRPGERLLAAGGRDLDLVGRLGRGASGLLRRARKCGPLRDCGAVDLVRAVNLHRGTPRKRVWREALAERGCGALRITRPVRGVSWGSCVRSERSSHPERFRARRGTLPASSV